MYWSWPSFFSALAGGSFTLVGVLIAHGLQSHKQKANEKDLVTATLKGIHDEIESLWDVYMESVGDAIESLEEGSPFMGYYIVSQDYFTFYNASAALLGRIKDAELRKSILVTYVNLKSLADTYKTNNESARKLEAIESLYLANGSQKHKMQLDQQLITMISYSISLKEKHISCKDLVQKLLKDLHNEVSKEN